MYKIKHVQAPQWRKGSGRHVVGSIRKESVTEFYGNEKEAFFKMFTINQLVKQHSEALRKIIGEFNEAYYDLIAENLKKK